MVHKAQQKLLLVET